MHTALRTHHRQRHNAGLGNRLAEMQLRILWEEVLRRDLKITVLDKPVYAYSNFLHAIRSLPAQIAA